MAGTRVSGIVYMWDDKRNSFGFARTPQSVDHFFHINALPEGWGKEVGGDKVPLGTVLEFVASEGPKGWKATEIRIVEVGTGDTSKVPPRTDSPPKAGEKGPGSSTSSEQKREAPKNPPEYEIFAEIVQYVGPPGSQLCGVIITTLHRGLTKSLSFSVRSAAAVSVRGQPGIATRFVLATNDHGKAKLWLGNLTDGVLIKLDVVGLPPKDKACYTIAPQPNLGGKTS